MSTCTKCGHDHQKLGVRIEKRVLYRSAISGHRVKAFGGAWGFSAKFWDAHRPEFDRIQITERDTRHVYRATTTTFDQHAYREILSAGYGLQVVLPLMRFNKPDELEHNEPDAEAVQPILLDVRPAPGTFYERAKRPRPRIEPKRRRWG